MKSSLPSLVVALSLPFVFSCHASASPKEVVAIDNIQGGLPAHQTARRFAELNLRIEMIIIKARVDCSCYVVPYHDGYKVLWLAESGGAVPADLKVKIENVIREGTLGSLIKD